jgi:LAS superfamily LD-carboxypeptidase LdcB
MSWETFKQNILNIAKIPEAINDIDIIATAYATEYDAAIKRGKDNLFQAKFKMGNSGSLKELFKAAFEKGNSQTQPYDLVGEMGKGVLSYWAGAQLDPTTVPNPSATPPATGAVQNIQITSINCLNSGTWQSPGPFVNEPDLRNENEQNDDTADTEIGEAEAIIGDVPVDEEADEAVVVEDVTTEINLEAEEANIELKENETPASPNPQAEDVIPKISKNVGATAPPIPPGLAQYAVGGKNGQIPKNKLGSIDSSYGGGILHIEAAKMYNKMIAKAKQDGIRWRVSSTYRDLAGQESCYAKYGPGSAAKPGYSPHGWGLALDFGEICGMQQDRAKATGQNRASASAARYTRENSKIYQWLAKNGPNYGWYNPYRLADGAGMDEAWHWEYWGFYTLTKQQRES